LVRVAVRAGRGRDAKRWLRTAERHAEKAELAEPNAGTAQALARYLWAARIARDPKLRPDDVGLVAEVAWYLRDRGLPREAERFAGQVIDWLRNPFDHLPRVATAEDAVRHMQLLDLGRSSLHALIAVAAAARRDPRTVRAAVARLDLQELSGLPTLTMAERAELHARIALALNRAGDVQAAAELDLALSESLVMAGRGERAAFPRLCEALVELLPADQATMIWAQWLRAAAEVDAGSAIAMVAAYVRRLPVERLAALTVDAETGELRRPG
jgi:hypothetical protein